MDLPSIYLQMKVLNKYQFGLLLCKSFGLDKNLIEPIQVNTIKHLVKRFTKMSLANDKIIKLLKINKNFFGINTQIKSLKNQNLKIQKINSYGTHFINKQDEKSVLKVLLEIF